MLSITSGTSLSTASIPSTWHVASTELSHCAVTIYGSPQLSNHSENLISGYLTVVDRTTGQKQHGEFRGSYLVKWDSSCYALTLDGRELVDSVMDELFERYGK